MQKNGRGMLDCVIIGGGVIGTLCAYYLCGFDGKFLLVEAGNDVSVGTTKANSGIVHAGFDALPGTLKAKYNVLGAAAMPELCRALDVPYKVNGALVVAFSGGEQSINELMERGRRNGVCVESISGDEARRIEHGLSQAVTAALYAPKSAVVSPYELAIAASEALVMNGGTLSVNTKVVGITRGEDGVYTVSAVRGGKPYTCRTRAIINAAGLYADVIHNLVADDKIEIAPRRGQYMLLDKTASPVTHTIFQTPTRLGKGVLVTPTCHGNTLIGPSAENIDDKTDVATTAGVLNDVFARAALSVPKLAKRDIITQFSGVRAVCGDDFIVGEAVVCGKRESGFFDAAGICSPGLASSPAIGKALAVSAAERLCLKENKNFIENRRAIPRFYELSDAERHELISRDDRYGHVVCRCECVTEGEIVEAIRRGAVDLDGIKRRVRAGMGRCQAGFCTAKLLHILARELGMSEEHATKSGVGSELLRAVDDE